MSYKEFLTATGNERFSDLLESRDFQMITSFKQTYIDALKQYYFIGGMPEAVLRFSENKDFNEVREIQRRIIDAYEQDFSKHAPNEIVPKIRMIWNSIPSQLAKENKKFIYGLVREGARAKDYETAIMWLSDTHDIQKTDNTFNQCNQYGEQKCYEKYVEPFELDSVYSINTFAIVNGNERIGIEKESEEMYFVFVSSNNNELIERYQLKPIERGKTYEGWINKEDVCLMEERSEIHI